MSSIQETLVSAGLEPSTAKIYLILAENGELPVASIIEKSELSRAGAYDALNILMAKEYIEYRKEGRNVFYKALHPDKFYSLIEQKKRETTLFEQEMNESIRTLIGSFNLANNKPGVRFFEGKEGMIEAYENILDIKQPILSIEDNGEMMNFFPDYVTKYVAKRVEREIPNRSIAPDTNKINDPNPNKFIDSRLIPVADFPFNMDIKICGDTVQIATLKKEQAGAVHITHPIIAENFRIIFEYMWKKASELPKYKNQAASLPSTTDKSTTDLNS